MAIRHKTLVTIFALMLAAGFSADAFARAGSGGSFGSRGARTYSAPPSTSTAPRGGSQFERSMTPNQGMFRPNAGAAGASRGGLFSGFGGGLLGGLLGAGLIGMLFGHGFGGGLGGGMSFIGLLLQAALLFFVIRFVMNYLRNRRPAMQGGPQGASFGGAPGLNPFGSNRDQSGPQQGFAGGGGGFGGSAPAQSPLQIQSTDFGAFEQRLFAVQKAYSDEDMNALRALTTPEMTSYFAEELGENARKGVVNKLSDVAFLQGDLAEAWREAGGDYASVALRFSLIDQTLDRATGRLVAGDPSTPQQATEIWTFTRRPGGGAQDWKLSGIQQA